MNEDRDGGEDCQGDQPEPQEHVDLLIDHVDRQQAECIMGLYGAGDTKLFIDALGHPWEYARHWICSSHRVRVNKCGNLKMDLIGLKKVSAHGTD